MKELTIEEKAEAYDKAIERAKKWYNAPNIDKMPTYGNRIIEEIFPELKESEDERIRKELINYLITDEDNGVSKVGQIPIDNVITWLEKQGQTFTKKDVDDAYLAGVRDAKQELEKQGEPVEINPTEFDTRLQSLIGKFESLPKEELIGSLSFWLNVVQNDGTYREEKQDEQKSIDYNEELKKCRENPLYFFDKYVKVKLKEQNPTWSEEDEERLQSCLNILQAKGLMGVTDTVNSRWLKSLKQRIGG